MTIGTIPIIMEIIPRTMEMILTVMEMISITLKIISRVIPKPVLSLKTVGTAVLLGI